MNDEKIIETLFSLGARGMLTVSQRNTLITRKVRKLSMIENFNYSRKAAKKLEGVNIEKKLVLNEFIKKGLKKSEINGRVIKELKIQLFK